jgi:hypothetical protein
MLRVLTPVGPEAKRRGEMRPDSDRADQRLM